VSFKVALESGQLSRAMHERLEIHDDKYEERRKVEEGGKERKIDIAALVCQRLGVGLHVDVNGWYSGGFDEGYCGDVGWMVAVRLVAEVEVQSRVGAR
jgi:hypothetical protein